MWGVTGDHLSNHQKSQNNVALRETGGCLEVGGLVGLVHGGVSGPVVGQVANLDSPSLLDDRLNFLP